MLKVWIKYINASKAKGDGYVLLLTTTTTVDSDTEQIHERVLGSSPDLLGTGNPSGMH